MSSGDGEYLPIVKVAPIYPRRAQTRGITGYCIVEYTVTASGAIRDPKAVDCQPAGVFDAASVKAATKFKYKPRVVDGVAIEVGGVQNKFTYELEQ
jgi:protein TonB